MAVSAHVESSPAAAAPRAPMRASRWPARLDLAQSTTGLLLGLFLGVHLLLDAAILIGPQAADVVARAFEGAYLFAQPQAWIISVVALVLALLVVVHAALALRKLPGNTAQLRAYRQHAGRMRHADTTLWWLQALTGFALFFLVAPHLLQAMLTPADIGAQPSARRIVHELMVVYYAVFLPVVVLHAAVGVHRVLLKWGHPPIANRARARQLMWAVAGLYLLIGSAALVAYVRYGLTLPPVVAS